MESPAQAVDAAVAKAHAALDRDGPERALESLVRVKRALEALPATAAASSRPVAAGSPPIPDPRSGRATRHRRDHRRRGRSVRARQRGAAEGRAGQLGDGARRGHSAPPGAAAAARDRASWSSAGDGGDLLALNRKNEITRRCPDPGRCADLSAVLAGVAARSADIRPCRICAWSARRRGRRRSASQSSWRPADETVRVAVPVVYAWTDPVHGERDRLFLVVPPATVTPARHAVLFPEPQAAREWSCECAPRERSARERRPEAARGLARRAGGGAGGAWRGPATRRRCASR